MDYSSQVVPGTPLPADAPRRWLRYAALGDSLSEGLGDPLTGGATRGWAHHLAAHLLAREPRLEFTNLAVRGYLARHALERQLGPALEFRPDLVSVFVGGNDVLLRRTFDPDRFTRELSALVEPFRAQDATVVLSTLPDLTACSPLLPPVRGALRQRIVMANEVVREVSGSFATVLLDAWSDPRTRRHAMWSIDRIHPSAAGHRLIAASVAELLGVPFGADDLPPFESSLLATVRRHSREAAWLLRYSTKPRVAAPSTGAAEATGALQAAGAARR
jgi:lysophospholipase L1-like esterase